MLGRGYGYYQAVQGQLLLLCVNRTIHTVNIFSPLHQGHVHVKCCSLSNQKVKCQLIFADIDFYPLLLVGEPITVPKVEEPTRDMVELYHAMYIKSLRSLFDKYKTRFGLKESDILHIQ